MLIGSRAGMLEALGKPGPPEEGVFHHDGLGAPLVGSNSPWNPPQHPAMQAGGKPCPISPHSGEFQLR